ncbi:MAG: FtsQ-type POTRA domain-containing protein [Actinobacteria bacterium]|nr:FtsQ-type POTRA domain-containing protein [Actinomycetota bacterium]
MTAPQINQRIEERRRGVSEDNARRRLRRLLLVATLVGVVALVAWLLQSPVFAVRDVVVRGVENSSALERLEAIDVVTGVATLSVKADAVQAELELDPWIKDSRVVVQWPGHVEIDVVEYVPVAAVQTGTTWVLVGEEGSVLESLPTSPPGLGTVTIATERILPGQKISDVEVVAAVLFIARVGDSVSVPTTVWNEGNELVATVNGYRVRIGPAVDVEAKAAAVVAILADGIPLGSVIDVVSPTRPAVAIPQPEVEE